MMNWCKQLTLLVTAASLAWIEQPRAVADDLVTEMFECHELNAAYQKIYSFETESYYISVCQLGSNFYYHRQSKLDTNSNILVPAEAVFRGNVFQANVGKATYFVGMDNDRHYSSVMLNNNEIVFEPEIESSVASSTPYAQNISDSGDLSLRNASLELDSPQENTEQILVCVRDKSATHPHLEGWQDLIGKSTRSVDKYALKNGHDFDYNREINPTLALITTDDGATIDLGIAPGREIVDRVCIQSSNEAGE